MKPEVGQIRWWAGAAAPYIITAIKLSPVLPYPPYCMVWWDGELRPFRESAIFADPIHSMSQLEMLLTFPTDVLVKCGHLPKP